MPRMLVIGGTEHIGKSLCIELLGDPDNHVICLDNPDCKLDLVNDRFVYRSHDLLWLNSSDVSVNIDYIYYIFRSGDTNIIELLSALKIARNTEAKFIFIAVSRAIPVCENLIDKYTDRHGIIYVNDTEPDMSFIVQFAKGCNRGPITIEKNC